MLTSGEDEHEWLEYLTWNTPNGGELRAVLQRCRGFDEEETLLGFATTDSETYLAVVRINLHILGTAGPETDLWVILCWDLDPESMEYGWRLQELSLSLPGSVQGTALLPSISCLEDVARQRYVDGRSGISADGTITRSGQEGEADDYWSQYGASSDEASEEQRTSVAESKHGDDLGDAHYARYESELEPVIASAGSRAAVKDDIQGDSTAAAIIPDLVFHAEQSLKSLRTLWLAAKLSDDQLRLVFERVLQT